MTHAAPLSLGLVQRRRKWFAGLALAALLALTAASVTIGGADGLWHERLEMVGLVCIAMAVVGRAWCSLYIGGRKKAEIVDRGPYSVTRNPLYLFSFLGAFGMGAQAGSLVLALLFTLAAVAVFLRTILREEAWLSAEFGATYEIYRMRTPRFLPNPRLWKDEDELTIRPTFFLRTLRDGVVMFGAVPAMEAIEALHASGRLGHAFTLL